MTLAKSNGKWTGKYKAQFTAPGGMRYLGQFDTPEAAHAAWWAEAGKMFGEFGQKE